MDKTYQSAVIKDPRSPEEKAKDHLHIAGATFNQWIEKPRNTWKRYKQRFQDGSYSCVFQSSAKALEVLTGKTVSALVYFLRKNYPQQGAYLQDAGDIFKNKLSAFEKDHPSQNLNEATMNVRKVYEPLIGAVGYRKMTPKSIDTIADAVLTYGQCILTFETTGDEWDEPNQTPKYKGQPVEFGHAICAVDFTLINGKKCLIAEDSAGQWSSADGLRIITEDFLKYRNTGAMSFTGAVDKSPNPNPPPKPQNPTPQEEIAWHTRLFRYFVWLFTGKEV